MNSFREDNSSRLSATVYHNDHWNKTVSNFRSFFTGFNSRFKDDDTANPCRQVPTVVNFENQSW